MIRDLFNLFDHKYPIENLHELDLSWMIKDVQQMEAILAEWEQVINELKDDVAKFDELAADVNAINDRIADYDVIKSITYQNQSDIKEFLTGFNTLVETVTRLQNALTQVLKDANAYTDSKFELMQVILNNKLYELQLKMNQMKVNIQSQIDALSMRIDDIDTTCINPWGRGRLSIQDNLNHAYSDLADMVPTASEYDAKDLSADEYDEYDLTALNYAEFGHKLLHMDFIPSSIFGFVNSHYQALCSVIEFIKGTMSADDYAALNLTADDYDALDITAADYYSYAAD